MHFSPVCSVYCFSSHRQGVCCRPFTIKTNKQNINVLFKLKLISSANGDIRKKKNGVIAEPNAGSISIPFHFKKKNDIVTAGTNDEYFVCGYILNGKQD